MQARKQINSLYRSQIFYKNYHESWGKNIWEKSYARSALPKMRRCGRDTTDIMIVSKETIVICNVQPYGRLVGYGEEDVG